MSRRLAFSCLLSLMLIPTLAHAQLDADHPGYFPLEEFGILPEGSINLEINLTGPMMRLIALATDEDDPTFSQIVKDLDSIRVRGADLDGVGLEEVRAGIQAATQRLTAEGWQTMVRIREDDEEIFIYFKDVDGEMVGLTVLSLEGVEAMLINLVGKIDPVSLSHIAAGLDLPQLERAVPEETP